MELKVRRPRRGDPLDAGLSQLDRYLDRLGLDTGYLIVFDRRPKPLRSYVRTEVSDTHTSGGKSVAVLRVLPLRQPTLCPTFP